MGKLSRPAGGLGLLLATGVAPASAAVYQLVWSGSVQIVEGDLGGSGIGVGDDISAAFQFDDAMASGPMSLPLGGGMYSIYNAPLAGFSLSIGAYTASYVRSDSTLTYMDNSFGGDGVVFSLVGLPGGPFGSTFANVQFQARGPVNAIDGSGLATGLPYDRFTPSFFATFSDSVAAKRVFGSLAVAELSAIPEPESWMLMVSGFGVLGAAMRYGSKRQQRLAMIQGNA